MSRCNQFVYLLLFTLLSCRTICAQSFDEDFSIWPADLKINGTVCVSSDPQLPDELNALFLKASGGDQAKIVVFDFSFADFNSELTSAFEDASSIDVMKIKADPIGDEQARDENFEDLTGVWLYSDSPLTKSQAKILDGLKVRIDTVIKNGGAICASGPVSSRTGLCKHNIVMGMSLVSEELNLIPDTVVYNDFNDVDMNKMLSALAANPKLVGIGVEPGTGFVLQGRKIRVYGSGKAAFALMANEHQPLRIQHVQQAADENADPYKTIVDLTAWRRDAIERRLAPFPTATPPTPHVENGALFIVGGGGLPHDLMKRFVAMAGGETAKLIYVPCTERDKVSGPSRMVEEWKEMGVASATLFHTKDRVKANSDDEFLQPLFDATGIWFGGGRQWNFSDSYYGTRAHRLMKEVLHRGGVIGGSSAGASIQADYLARANPVANFDIMAPGYERGLGFLKGTAIDQHFSQRGRQKDMTELANRYPQLLGIGIDEGTALIVQKSIGEVVGRGKVHFYDRSRPVIPGEPDFLAYEEGNFFDLAKRALVEASEEAAADPISNSLPAENRELIGRAVLRLLELQEDDGAWPYEGVYRVSGQIPVGYRIGGTAIACQALLSAPVEPSSEIGQAISRGVELILTELEHPLMKPSTEDKYDVRVWGHMYALDLFCQLESNPGFDDIKVHTKPKIESLIAALVTEELNSGGWNYASRGRHACFVTAPAVHALLRAKSIGFAVPDEVFERAAAALLASRVESGAFQYSGTVEDSRRTDLLPGAIARAAVSETTLSMLDKGNVDNLRAAIDAFHEHWDELEKRRKQTGTHKPPFGVAPYYFYYGHRYLAQAIQMLPEDDREAEFLRFEKVLLRTKDDDDTWNDRVFDRSKAYGTAMSILALSREHVPLPTGK